MRTIQSGFRHTNPHKTYLRNHVGINSIWWVNTTSSHHARLISINFPARRHSGPSPLVDCNSVDPMRHTTSACFRRRKTNTGERAPSRIATRTRTESARPEVSKTTITLTLLQRRCARAVQFILRVTQLNHSAYDIFTSS